MPRLFSYSLILACSLCLATPAAASLAPVPGLTMEPHAEPGGGDGLQLNLRPTEEGPLERLTAGGRVTAMALHPHEAEPTPPVWGSPLRVFWSGSVPVRCSAALAASYAVPDTSDALSLGEVLDGGRFRAWVRSGVQWRYTAEAVLALDARWSPAGLHGFDSAPPFQAAATVTVPW